MTSDTTFSSSCTYTPSSPAPPAPPLHLLPPPGFTVLGAGKQARAKHHADRRVVTSHRVHGLGWCREQHAVAKARGWHQRCPSGRTRPGVPPPPPSEAPALPASLDPPLPRLTYSGHMLNICQCRPTWQHECFARPRRQIGPLGRCTWQAASVEHNPSHTTLH